MKKSILLNLKDNEDISMINIIKSKFPIGSKILEISCGNGVDSLYLKNIGYDVTCTELNDDYVNNAKDLGLNCIKHNTLDKFPFKEKEYDLVYCRLGLHYFSEDELNNILKDINRISKNLLMSVKTVNDISTGKVIFDKMKWKNIISKYFNIISFEEKSGILYDNKSEWIESFSKSRNIKTFENFKYNLIQKLNERLHHKDEYISNILKDNGYKIIGTVGGGYFGHIYELEDNKVCKVCYSRDEINTANRLIGQHNEYLVDYYDVFKGKEFDIIIMEKINTDGINKEKLKRTETLIEKVLIDHLESWRYDVNPNSVNIIFSIFKNYGIKYLFNSYLIDIIRMYKESSKYGKLSLDMHHGNFGMKNGHLVAFDFRLDRGLPDGGYIKKLKEIESDLLNARKYNN